jgi:uncharacterized protein (TIGR02145 family)
MKTLFSTLLFLTSFLYLLVQAQPEAFNYSGVARDGSSNPVSNSSIGIEFSILKGSAAGPVQYRERHSALTDDIGIFVVSIGKGSVEEGDFSTIDWGADDYFLAVGIDITGGSNYTLTGTTQLLSVPYALYAKSAGSAPAASVVAGEFIKVTGTGTQDDPYVISATRGYTGPAIFAEGSGVTDIDGNTYNTVVIGGQEWMAENLVTTKYRNGNPIPNVQPSANWRNLTAGAWCDYNNNPDRDEVYGKLYNFFAIRDSRQICPAGWHVPSEQEWITLFKTIDPFANPFKGTSGFAGGMMKSTGTLQNGNGLWMFPNAEASNGSGFSGVPGGRRLQDGNFSPLGFDGYWWSSTESGLINAVGMGLYYGLGACNRVVNPKKNGLSVRCVKD